MDSSPELQQDTVKRARYWQRTRRLTGALLALWALVALGLTWFARDLSGFVFFGWPFSFWVAAQGAVLAFCAIVAFHAWAMRRLDEEHR